jgi:hypothetical protein
MLERVFTANRINEIVNDDSILPMIKGKHTKLDLTNFAKVKHNVCLVGDYGCVLFAKLQEGIYEFHTSVLPDGRGTWMIEGSREAFKYMFTNTDAFELLTKCPDGNVPAKAGARAVGCGLKFSTRPTWPIEDKLVPVDVYSILLQDWPKNAQMQSYGEEFHNLLESKLNRQNHDHDVVHDNYVGCTVEMIRGGQIGKAINFYNRWAVMSDYARIKIDSLDPLIIDISEAKLKIENNNFEVI